MLDFSCQNCNGCRVAIKQELQLRRNPPKKRRRRRRRKRKKKKKAY
jgi:hypothetical protein